MPNLDDALWLLTERKFSIIPVHHPDMVVDSLPANVQLRVDPKGKEYNERDIGKLPLIDWKAYQTTLPKVGEVETWWGPKKWADANIAVCCGEVSGIFVVDCDNDSALQYMASLGVVPGLTLTAKTGRGWQFYFLWPGFEVSNSLGQLLPGLDIKGSGGYVVAPPSKHRNGSLYEWVEGVLDPMPAPEELLALIRRASKRKEQKVKESLPPAEIHKMLVGPIPDGERHNTAKKLFAHLVGIGTPEKAVREFAITWGMNVCQPPADIDHLQKIINWALEQEQSKYKNPEEPTMERQGDDFIFTWPDLGLRAALTDLHGTGGRVEGTLDITSEATGDIHYGDLILGSTSKREELTHPVRGKLTRIRNDLNWDKIIERICKLAATMYRKGEATRLLKPSPATTARVIQTGLPGPRPFYLPLNETTVLFADGGTGKMIDKDTPIPTPSGWQRMGDLQIGDYVFDEQGKPCLVLAIHDGIPEKAYRLSFSDNTYIDACSEHLWLTHDHRTRMTGYMGRRLGNRSGRRLPARQLPDDTIGPKIRTTQEIVDTLHYRTRGDLNHSILLTEPLSLPVISLPIDPYVLGVWLGDGASAAAEITTADKDMVMAVQAAGHPIRPRVHKYGYGIGGLQTQLRANGLLKHKHIPTIYLRASAEQRLALLQGLMDSDGCVTGSTVEFTSTNQALAESVLELARSLGQKPTLRTGRATLYGKDCGPKYRVAWRPLINPFRLPRKAARVLPLGRQANRNRHRMITAARLIDPKPMRCIRVSSESGLFLAGEGMIPTHNSLLALTVGVNVSDRMLVFFLDWESTHEEHEERLAAVLKGLTNPPPGQIHYRRMVRPLWQQVSVLRAEIDRLLKETGKTEVFIIADSYGPASMGAGDWTEAAIRTMDSLHSLGENTTRLLLTHVTKEAAERADGAGKPIACYASDTEVLTSGGWKRHGVVTTGDTVLTFDPTTLQLSWAHPLQVHAYDYTGPMISFASEQLDLLVTPEHRMVARPTWTKDKRGKPLALRRPNSLARSWQFREATKLHSGWKLLWSPGSPLTTHTSVETVQVGDKTFPETEFAAFLGWWLTEGTISDWAPQLSQAKGPKADVLQSVLQTLDMDFHVSTVQSRGKQPQQLIRVRQATDLGHWLVETCGRYDAERHLPAAWLHTLSTVAREALFQAMIDGAGCRRPRGYISFCTTSEALASDMQALAITLGRASWIKRQQRRHPRRDAFYVQISPTSHSAITLHKPYKRTVGYEGKVYCLTVPGGAYVVRRNGKLAVCGNSAYVYNLARSVWEMRQGDSDDENAILLRLDHRKANRGKKFRPTGFQIGFTESQPNVLESVVITWRDPGIIAINGHIALENRILQALKSLGGKATPSEIAEELGEKPDTVSKTLRKQQRLFVRVTIGGGRGNESEFALREASKDESL